MVKEFWEVHVDGIACRLIGPRISVSFMMTSANMVVLSIPSISFARNLILFIISDSCRSSTESTFPNYTINCNKRDANDAEQDI